VPFFGGFSLDKITAADVNKWLLGFKKREVTTDGKKEIKEYKNTYANSVFRTLMERNGKGFVFSLDGGATPVSRNNLYTGLQEALKKIGIDGKEMRRRGLTLHSWRHFQKVSAAISCTLKINFIHSETGEEA